jgi:hypothetical protein
MEEALSKRVLMEQAHQGPVFGGTSGRVQRLLKPWMF